MMLAEFYAPVPLLPLLPELLLVACACVLLLLGQSTLESRRRLTPVLTLAGIGLALLILTFQTWNASGEPEGGGLLFNSLAAFARKGALVLGFVLTLVAWHQPSSAERGDFFALSLLSLVGLMLVGSAQDLLVLFMALELVSIPTYVMVVLSRMRGTALEAGTKYFYLGAASAAIMGYGFAFLYGVSGSASLHGSVAAALSGSAPGGSLTQGLAMVGMTLAIAGLLFKIAAVPFHFYIADVYQGAASPVAGFLGFVPKLAGMLALAKLLEFAGWQTTSAGLFWVLWIVAALSMTVGNLLALRQTNIKRMLAYSGIAHSGYMLVGLLAGPAAGIGMVGDGIAAVLYYTVIYGIANLGAFALLALLRTGDRSCETLRDVAGLIGRSPGVALLLVFVMFTLMGMPPTPGFWGKLTLFGSALSLSQADGTPAALSPWIVALVIIAVVNSAIGAAYYLRVIASVMLYDNDDAPAPAPREALHMGAVLCGMLLLIFTFFPNFLLQAGAQATAPPRARLMAVAPSPIASSPPAVPSVAAHLDRP